MGEKKCHSRGVLESHETSQQAISIASNQVMTGESPKVMEIMLDLVLQTGQIKYVDIIQLKNETYLIHLFNSRISRSYCVTLMRIINSRLPITTQYN